MSWICKVIVSRWLATALLAPALLAAIPARAAELPTASVRIAWLKNSTIDPSSAIESWVQEVRLRTSIQAEPRAPAVRPEDPTLFHFPLLYWAGDRAPPRLSDAAVANLRQHLSTGGTLIIDNAGRAEASGAFDAAVRRELLRIFPQPLQKVPPGHVIFRSFYRLEQALGRRADSRDLEGLRVGGHFAVLYTRNDLQGALARQSIGGFAMAVVPGGETQREAAIRLAVNLLMYALCLDYKDDHTHVLYLLRHRRGEESP
ncbi:MAG: DUF4159 domain-containing protein [Deltaproteobacteria bacterium]|nr:DUF4159 domain-containing protein [Deltaproteobacteria bacterium]